jgi:hypothetical protein
MRLKMKQRWAGAFGSHDVGAIVEVPDEVGEGLLKGDYAERPDVSDNDFIDRARFSVAEVCKLFGITPEKLKAKLDRFTDVNGKAPVVAPKQVPKFEETIAPTFAVEVPKEPVVEAPVPNPKAALLSAPAEVA